MLPKLILLYWWGSNLVIFTFAEALHYCFKKVKLLKIHPDWSLSCDSSNSECVAVQHMLMNLVVFRRWEHFPTLSWGLKCNLLPLQSQSFIQLSFWDQNRIWSTSGTIHFLSNVLSCLVGLLTLNRCSFECKAAKRIKQVNFLMESKICFSSFYKIATVREI